MLKNRDPFTSLEVQSTESEFYRILFGRFEMFIFNAAARVRGPTIKLATYFPIIHLITTAMFDPEKDRIHAINHRLDQLRGYL